MGERQHRRPTTPRRADTALTDLDETGTDALARLHHALGDTDASELPALLAAIRHHLPEHRDLADQIDAVTAHTDRILHQRSAQGRGRSPSSDGGGVCVSAAASRAAR